MNFKYIKIRLYCLNRAEQKGVENAYKGKSILRMKGTKLNILFSFEQSKDNCM